MSMKRSVLACALVGGLCVLALTPAARADGKLRVAVKRFVAEGVAPATASALESSFCQALGAEAIDVLCPSDIQALVQLKQAQMSFGTCGDDDEKCVRELAKLTEATRIVTGKISKVGGLYLVNLTLLDAASGKVIARTSDRATKEEELVDKLAGLAKKLARAK